MESIGAMFNDGEWINALNGMYNSTSHELEAGDDFMAQLLGNGNCSVPITTCNFELSTSSSSANLWHSQENECPNYSSEETSAAAEIMYSFSSPYNNHNYVYPMSSAGSAWTEFLNQDLSNDSMDQSAGEAVSEGTIRDHEIIIAVPAAAHETSVEDSKEDSLLSETSKKRSLDHQVKNKRTVKPKKNHQKINDESISCPSEEDDSSNGGGSGSGSAMVPLPPALNLNGKTRANRGSATDPQSLYARKRRERINERLRILQNLVPNGTKVDISTMLEEAVQYVKFLQLQIKLLSSDELWMYAPIAYNGMDIGLDLKIDATPKSS